MKRLAIALSLGLTVSLALFYGMALMITKGKDLQRSDANESFIDFVRIKPQDQIQERQRKLPKKPPEPKTPPTAQALKVAANKPNQPNLKMNIPNIGPGVKGGLGPGFGQGGTGYSQNSDETPLVRINPTTPQKARIEGVEGWAEVEFNINEKGEVDAARLIDESPRGYGFGKEARKAILQWKYRPKIIDGKPQSRTLAVRLDFGLEGE